MRRHHEEIMLVPAALGVLSLLLLRIKTWRQK